jgi:hypothetical protein
MNKVAAATLNLGVLSVVDLLALREYSMHFWEEMTVHAVVASI